jgi:hypothetical protein
MQQITLEFIGRLGIGLALWIGALLIAVVPENRAKVAKLLHGIVKSFQTRSPIVAVRYVDEDEETLDTPDGTQYRDVPDTYHLEPAGIEQKNTSIALADTADLVRHLAGLRLTDGKYAMSGNRITQAVEMSRNDVLALVREVRGAEPPKPDPSEPQFVKVGEREQYQRINAKPIR